jgi:hypothetical protein
VEGDRSSKKPLSGLEWNGMEQDRTGQKKKKVYFRGDFQESLPVVRRTQWWADVRLAFNLFLLL